MKTKFELKQLSKQDIVTILEGIDKHLKEETNITDDTISAVALHSLIRYLKKDIKKEIEEELRDQYLQDEQERLDGK
jgi:hypothetical protein